jgi:hypothetical protein
VRRTGSTPYNITTSKQTPESGISKLPQVLPYPKFMPDSLIQHVNNVFCYVIRHYGNDGLSVLVYRQPEKDQIVVLYGDWNGNNIDLTTDNQLSKTALEFCDSKLQNVLYLMKLIRIEQAQLFFTISDRLTLVDVQTAYNKMASPGMVRDIFSKMFDVQEVIKTEIIDDRIIDAIARGAGSYSGDIILKPTRFRLYHDPVANLFQPMYIEAKR